MTERHGGAARRVGEPEHPESARTRRIHDSTLAPLAARIERRRRVLAAEAELRTQLEQIGSADDWLCVQSMAGACGVTIPFLVVGPTGVFVLAASDGGWHLSDLAVWAPAVAAVKRALPGYPDPVRLAIVLVFDRAEPRRWYCQGGGGWVLGGSHLALWLTTFGDVGFAPGDVARLREQARTRWDRRVSPAPLWIARG
jgi:hypothetical protein